jgi:hypothetical protein
MGVITAIKERLMPAREPAERRPLGRQGLDIKEARRALRVAIAKRNDARAALAQGAAKLAMVEGNTAAAAAELESAEKRAQDTAEAALTFQRDCLARGDVPPRGETERLAREAAMAARTLQAARGAASTAEAAALDVLPGLREKDSEAQSRLNRLEESVLKLSRDVIRAELDQRMAGIYPALKQVREFYALACVVDKSTGIGISQPDIPIVRCFFAQDELARAMRDHGGDRWREIARRLREDSEAQFDV